MTNPMSHPTDAWTWSFEAVQRLRVLAAEGAPADAISLKLGRPVADVRAKATELGLPLKGAG